MLEYLGEAKRLVSTFLSYRNDIDIYTEDEIRDKEFYRVLFSRLLKPELKINDVTPLGSKSNVIERCKNEPKGGRKKVFLVDGDIDLVCGKTNELENLFVLEKYCIENYLIDIESTSQFVYLNCGTMSIEDVKKALDFDNWLTGYTESLISLFIHFAILNLNGSAFNLFNANKYHQKCTNVFRFNDELVKNDILEIKKEIIEKYGEDIYNNQLTTLQNKWESNLENLLTIVSGKDYLIPILLFQTLLFKSSKSLPSLSEVKINLVQNFDVSKLNKLKFFIEN